MLCVVVARAKRGEVGRCDGLLAVTIAQTVGLHLRAGPGPIGTQGKPLQVVCQQD